MIKVPKTDILNLTSALGVKCTTFAAKTRQLGKLGRLGWTRMERINSDGLGRTRMDSDGLGWANLSRSLFSLLGETYVKDSDGLARTRMDSDGLT